MGKTPSYSTGSVYTNLSINFFDLEVYKCGYFISADNFLPCPSSTEAVLLPLTEAGFPVSLCRDITITLVGMVMVV